MGTTRKVIRLSEENVNLRLEISLKERKEPKLEAKPIELRTMAVRRRHA